MCQQTRPTITVVVVDDHEAVRIGLRTILDATPDLKVVGEAADAGAALALARSTLPDVAVVDIGLPDADGITLCRDLRSLEGGPVCVVLSSYTEEEARLGAAVAGAAAFVAKTTAVDELSDVIREVAKGATLLNPDAALRTLRERAAEDPRSRLSPQERRLLDLIAEGMTNRQIGAALHLTEKTVKNYVSRMLAKLDLHSRAAAAALSARLREKDRMSRPWVHGDHPGESDA